MPRHDVTVAIPQKLVLSKDVEFEVKSDGKLLGNLLISKGNIEWRPAKASVNKLRLSWERFAALMSEEGSNAKIKNGNSQG
ncbi:hypothetical protein [Hydrogenophaga aquatica]